MLGRVARAALLQPARTMAKRRTPARSTDAAKPRKRKPRAKGSSSAEALVEAPVEAPADGAASDEASTAKRPIRSKRSSPRETEHETVVDPGARSAPTKPWWLVGLVAVVIGVVAYVRYADGDARREEAARDVELDAPPVTPEHLRVEVIHTFPHQRDAFTQGLLWHDGHLYESTGLRGHSSLRKLDLETGEVLERRSVDSRLFAEGLALVGDRLIQLTWQAGEAHVWTLDGFEHRRTFAYDGEGWGLCYDGQSLVMSDGSDRLTFRDPNTFRVQRVVRVREEGHPVDQLNELECVDGVVWANVWQTDRIVRIDPRTGAITGTVDARGLLSEDEEWVADVLNGIAWIPERHHFVITGKNWPHLYEVDFVPEDTDPTEEHE